MKRRKPARRTYLVPSIKRKSRKPGSREWVRIYGTQVRVRWVCARACVVCGREPSEDRPSHGHHVRTGGTSRKADAMHIVPLCHPCHDRAHRKRIDWTPEQWDDAADQTETAWQAYSDT